jgi:hypothetical protein
MSYAITDSPPEIKTTDSPSEITTTDSTPGIQIISSLLNNAEMDSSVFEDKAKFEKFSQTVNDFQNVIRQNYSVLMEVLNKYMAASHRYKPHDNSTHNELDNSTHNEQDGGGKKHQKRNKTTFGPKLRMPSLGPTLRMPSQKAVIQRWDNTVNRLEAQHRDEVRSLNAKHDEKLQKITENSSSAYKYGPKVHEVCSPISPSTEIPEVVIFLLAFFAAQFLRFIVSKYKKRGGKKSKKMRRRNRTQKNRY